MTTTARLREYQRKQDDELRHDLEALRKELFNLRFQSTTEKLANPARISQVRRDIARILTILNERKRRGGAAAADGEQG